jgi:hypothetical protein
MADSTNATITYHIYTDCPFKGRCSDENKKCETCKYNPKRSYYEPVEPYYPYIPYVPYPYPYYPYYTTTTIGDATTTTFYTTT